MKLAKTFCYWACRHAGNIARVTVVQRVKRASHLTCPVGYNNGNNYFPVLLVRAYAYARTSNVIVRNC